MVIFHSYVSLPEGIYYDPGIVSIYIWLQQRRLRQKKDVRQLGENLQHSEGHDDSNYDFDRKSWRLT